MYNLFLDSGAFSAMTQNKEINLDDYIAFIKKNIDYISCYANLDVIGDDEASYENLIYMQEHGLDPIPVYHYDDKMEYLELFLEDYSYIAIGGAAGRMHRAAIIKWLDLLWTRYLSDDEGMPIVDVHGFGITSIPMLLRYPWYSVDSTRWIRQSISGGIIVPRKLSDGIYDYATSPYALGIAYNSQQRFKYNEHIDNCSKLMRDTIIEYLELNGFALKDLRESYLNRMDVNVFYFNEFSKHKEDVFKLKDHHNVPGVLIQ